MCKKFKEMIVELVKESYYKPTEKLLKDKISKADITEMLISFYQDYNSVEKALLIKMINLYTDSQKLELVKMFLEADERVMINNLMMHEMIEE